MSLDLTHTPRTYTSAVGTKPCRYVLANCGHHDETTVHVCTTCGVAYDPTHPKGVCAEKLAKELTPGMVEAILLGKELA